MLAGYAKREERTMSNLKPTDQVTGEATEHERALETAQAAFGASSIEAAEVLLRLGGAHRSAGRMKEAQWAWVRALEIIEGALGTDHVQLAGIYHCLAELELARGRFATGEPYARRSLEICERAAGIPRAVVAASMQVLAALLAGQGRSAESAFLHRSAIALSGAPAEGLNSIAEERIGRNEPRKRA
jgi:hypothetical protein